MYHLLAYSVSIGQTVDTDMTAIQDDIIAIQNNHFLPPNPYNVLKAFLSSATMLRGKISSPKIRQFNPVYIRPVNVALLPANNPNIATFPPEMLRISAQEELQILATSGLGAGNENAFALLWLSDGVVPAPINDVFWCRATSTGTATAGKWTTIAYGLETLLPAGLYAMVASEAISTTGIAHRWIFSNQFLRPGNLSTAVNGNRTDRFTYEFILGQMGQFRTFDLPRLQVLCNAADASFEIYFAVARIGN